MLRFMRREGGEGGDGGGGNDPAGNGGGAQGGGGGGAGAGGGDGGDKPITLTTAQLNERLERARNGALTDFAKQNGYEKPDEVTAAVKSHKETTDAQKTELQRATEAAAAAEARAANAETRAQSVAIQQAIYQAAGKAGVPSDRLEAAVKLVDSAAITVGDDGRVVGVDEAVTKMLEESPFIKATTTAGGGRGADGGAGGGGGSGAASLTPEQKQAAKILGMTEEAYAKGLLGKPGTETHGAYVDGHRKPETAKA